DLCFPREILWLHIPRTRAQAVRRTFQANSLTPYVFSWQWLSSARVTASSPGPLLKAIRNPHAAWRECKPRTLLLVSFWPAAFLLGPLLLGRSLEPRESSLLTSGKPVSLARDFLFIPACATPRRPCRQLCSRRRD